MLSSLVEDLALRSVPERLARLLLARIESGCQGSAYGSRAATRRRMTQREMAAQLGTVREVVARNLADLERRGWIQVRRGVIEIVDPDALRAFASGDVDSRPRM